MYPLVAPKLFNERLIGETLLEDASFLKGKTVITNLFNLMGDMKRQYIELGFRVVEVKDNKGVTELTQYRLSNAFLKRIVRRGRNKIDDSFIIKDANGAFLRIKPLIITLGRASKPIQTDLLKSMRSLLAEIVPKMAFDHLVRDLMDYKLQKELKVKLTKLYPVKQVELRYVGLEPTAKKENVQQKLVKLRKENVEEAQEEKLAEKIRKTQKQTEKKEQEAEPVQEEKSEGAEADKKKPAAKKTKTATQTKKKSSESKTTSAEKKASSSEA